MIRQRHPLRRVPMIRRTRLRSISKRRQAGARAWDSVTHAVFARARGRCEVCRRPAQDPHHTRKPRARWNTPEWVIALCRRCHARVEAPYARGRLVITPLGGGRFQSEIVTKPWKWSPQPRGPAPLQECSRGAE